MCLIVHFDKRTHTHTHCIINTGSLSATLNKNKITQIKLQVLCLLLLSCLCLVLCSVVGFTVFFVVSEILLQMLLKPSEILHHEDVALVEFMYAVITCMLCELL